MATQNKNYPPKKDYNDKYNKPKDKKPVTKFDLFTGGKTPAFAVFYNLAFFRIAGMVYYALDPRKGKQEKEQIAKGADEKEIQTVFENWLKKPEDISGLIFPKLKDYLWKGYNDNKNSEGYSITEEDKKLIVSMLQKLNEIRNFHSHIYHDNVVLQVSDDLRNAINKLHKAAFQSFIVESPREVEKYEGNLKERPFFSQHENKWFFKKDGRVFFLSFFLTSGEMSRFLNQCKGYKRNDNDKHELLHKVFRFYTHRDGATRQHYGHTENVMDNMSQSEKQQTHNGRQAYKLISYINDVPMYCRNTTLMPLYLNGNALESIADYTDFCEKYNLFQGILTLSEYYETKEVKIDGFKEEITELRDNYLKINILDKKYNHVEAEEKHNAREHNQHFDEAAYELTKQIQLKSDKLAYFEKCIADEKAMPVIVSKNTFHRLILDALRLQDNGQTLQDMLSDFVEERKTLYRFFYDAPFKDAQMELYKHNEDDEYLDVYYRYKLRSENLTAMMGEWKAGKTWKAGFEKEVLTAPIELDYYNFFYAQERKIRKQDSFMYFAVRYLIDFQIINWQFMFECFKTEEEWKEELEFGQKVKKLVMVKKRHVKFSQTFPEQDNESDDDSKWRLAIDGDNHIMVAFFEGKDPSVFGVSKEATHKFAIGPKAMRAILMAHFDGKNDLKNLFDFIINDIDLVRNNDSETPFKLLTSNEIPDSFKIKRKEKRQDDAAAIKVKAIKYIDNQLDTIKNLLADDNFKQVRRAERNRFIMQWYTLYEWNYPNDSKFKFLRKNEYKQMSIYHYCLDRKKNPKVIWRFKNYEFLVKDAWTHTPVLIKNWLETAQSFDDLFVKVATKTADELKTMKRYINELPIKLAKPTLSKLGFHIHDKPNEGNKNPDHIPFALHPMLVLRKFYKNELKNVKTGEQDQPNNSRFSLSKKFRKANTSFENKLIVSNYQIDNYLQCLKNEYLTNSKSNIRHINGEVNDAKIQDMVLAKMADNYLKNSSANYRTFLASNESDWQAKSMRKTVINLPFEDKKYGFISMKIRFHQLDDFLLVEGREIISKAIYQVMERLTKDEKFMKSNAESTDRDKITQKANVYEIPYEQVFKEIQRVYNHSLRWGTHLLEWERSVISNLGDSKLQETAQKNVGKAHINFTEVLHLANLEKEKSDFLNELRKHVFHVKIPAEFTYWELAKTKDYDWLRKILRYNDVAIAEKYK